MYTFPFVPFRYSKTLSIGILILALCLIPSSKLSKLSVPVTSADVIVHFLMFFVFSAALCTDIARKRAKQLSRLSVILVALAISFGFAILTELLQYFITPLNRSGNMADLLSDLLGSITGIALVAFIRRRSASVS
jgi:VanZ family protein